MREDPIETIEYKSYTINIYSDLSDRSPREWDNFSEIAIPKASKWAIGDVELSCEVCRKGKDYVEKMLIENYGALLIKPLYIFEHTGVCIRTTPFNDLWDSGFLGFVYTTNKRLANMMGINEKITKSVLDKVEKYIEQEVDMLSKYMNGECYGYDIEDTEEFGWGIIGLNDAISEARSVIDRLIKTKEDCDEKLLNGKLPFYQSQIMKF